MAVYEELIKRVECGETFYIDFKSQTIKIGKEKVIYGQVERQLIDVYPDNIVDHIEKLYENYRHSVPGERSDSKYHKCFKALPADELSDAELTINEPREVAQAKLEGFILCAVLDNRLSWVDFDTEDQHWFWQSKNHPDLIILRDWIINKNK